MTSRLKQTFIELLAACAELKNTDKFKTPVFKYVNVWNSQIDDAIAEKQYSFDCPGVFVEINSGIGNSIGGGFTSFPEVMVRFHIIDNKLNDGDFMDRNIDVLDYRGEILKKFNFNKKITYLNRLTLTEDKEDYHHGNISKYLLSFKTSYIESRTGQEDSSEGCKGYIRCFKILIKHKVFSVTPLLPEYQGFDVTYTITEDTTTFKDNIPDGAVIRNVLYLNNGELNGWREQGITRNDETKEWDFSVIGGLLSPAILTIIYGFEN